MIAAVIFLLSYIHVRFGNTVYRNVVSIPLAPIAPF